MNFREYIQQGFVFLDGATGSNLQEHGMQAGECPELWILNHPDVFVELQKSVEKQFNPESLQILACLMDEGHVSVSRVKSVCDTVLKEVQSISLPLS